MTYSGSATKQRRRKAGENMNEALLINPDTGGEYVDVPPSIAPNI